MHCPNCDEYVVIEDFQDTEPFPCKHCGQLLQLDIDEGTYYGATHTTLRVVDEE